MKKHKAKGQLFVFTSKDDALLLTIGDEEQLGIVAWREDAIANARRIVACWNACEGISTEKLESGTVVCIPPRGDENINPFLDKLLAERFLQSPEGERWNRLAKGEL